MLQVPRFNSKILLLIQNKSLILQVNFTLRKSKFQMFLHLFCATMFLISCVPGSLFSLMTTYNDSCHLKDGTGTSTRVLLLYSSTCRSSREKNQAKQERFFDSKLLYLILENSGLILHRKKVVYFDCLPGVI